MGILCDKNQQHPRELPPKAKLIIEKLGRFTFALIQGEIYNEKVDAIVIPREKNPLSSSVLIRAGEDLKMEIKNQRGDSEVKMGDVTHSGGGQLFAKHLFHIALPAWNGGHFQELDILKRGLNNCLMMSEDYKIKTLGISDFFGKTSLSIPEKYGFEVLAKFMKKMMEEIDSTHPTRTIKFVTLESRKIKIYLEIIETVWNPTNNTKESFSTTDKEKSIKRPEEFSMADKKEEEVLNDDQKPNTGIDQSASKINNSELTEFNAENLKEKLAINETSYQNDSAFQDKTASEIYPFPKNNENSDSYNVDTSAIVKHVYRNDNILQEIEEEEELLNSQFQKSNIVTNDFLKLPEHKLEKSSSVDNGKFDPAHQNKIENIIPAFEAGNVPLFVEEDQIRDLKTEFNNEEGVMALPLDQEDLESKIEEKTLKNQGENFDGQLTQEEAPMSKPDMDTEEFNVEEKGSTVEGEIIKNLEDEVLIQEEAPLSKPDMHTEEVYVEEEGNKNDDIQEVEHTHVESHQLLQVLDEEVPINNEEKELKSPNPIIEGEISLVSNNQEEEVLIKEEPPLSKPDMHTEEVYVEEEGDNKEVKQVVDHAYDESHPILQVLDEEVPVNAEEKELNNPNLNCIVEGEISHVENNQEEEVVIHEEPPLSKPDMHTEDVYVEEECDNNEVKQIVECAHDESHQILQVLDEEVPVDLEDKELKRTNPIIKSESSHDANNQEEEVVIQEEPPLSKPDIHTEDVYVEEDGNNKEEKQVIEHAHDESHPILQVLDEEVLPVNTEEKELNNPNLNCIVEGEISHIANNQEEEVVIQEEPPLSKPDMHTEEVYVEEEGDNKEEKQVFEHAHDESHPILQVLDEEVPVNAEVKELNNPNLNCIVEGEISHTANNQEEEVIIQEEPPLSKPDMHTEDVYVEEEGDNKEEKQVVEHAHDESHPIFQVLDEEVPVNAEAKELNNPNLNCIMEGEISHTANNHEEEVVIQEEPPLSKPDMHTEDVYVEEEGDNKEEKQVVEHAHDESHPILQVLDEEVPVNAEDKELNNPNLNCIVEGEISHTANNQEEEVVIQEEPPLSKPDMHTEDVYVEEEGDNKEEKVPIDNVHGESHPILQVLDGEVRGYASEFAEANNNMGVHKEIEHPKKNECCINTEEPELAVEKEENAILSKNGEANIQQINEGNDKNNENSCECDGRISGNNVECDEEEKYINYQEDVHQTQNEKNDDEGFEVAKIEKSTQKVMANEEEKENNCTPKIIDQAFIQENDEIVIELTQNVANANSSDLAVEQLNNEKSNLIEELYMKEEEFKTVRTDTFSNQEEFFINKELKETYATEKNEKWDSPAKNDQDDEDLPNFGGESRAKQNRSNKDIALTNDKYMPKFDVSPIVKLPSKEENFSKMNDYFYLESETKPEIDVNASKDSSVVQKIEFEHVLSRGLTAEELVRDSSEFYGQSGRPNEIGLKSSIELKGEQNLARSATGGFDNFGGSGLKNEVKTPSRVNTSNSSRKSSDIKGKKPPSKKIDIINVFTDDIKAPPEEEEKKTETSFTLTGKDLSNNAIVEKDLSMREEISQLSENISIQSELLTELSDLNKSNLMEKDDQQTMPPKRYSKEKNIAPSNLNKSFNSKRTEYRKSSNRKSSRGGGGGGVYKVVYEKKE